jgi:hypothetical protein
MRQNEQHAVQNTEYICSKTHVHKITNRPVFIWRLGSMILMGANPLLGPLERVGPESLDFQGPPLPKALEMDFPLSKSLLPRHINNWYIISNTSYPYLAPFNNVFTALNLLLITLFYLCSRNSATWHWHSAPHKNTEFSHGWPFVISITSCKV